MDIQLRSIPVTETTNWLDCTTCGPLGVVATHLTRTVAYLHLNYHGIATPEEPMTTTRCECGYDYAHPTGYPTDTAACTECGWTGHGFAADHMGHHHYRDTGHHWRLTIKEQA
jgi:hypothetical protein